MPRLDARYARRILRARAAVLPVVTGAIAHAAGPYTPAQMRHAYGFDLLPFDGTGQTIAIIDAYRSGTEASDLNTFDNTFGLPAANLTTVYTSGTSQTAVAPAINSGWASEISLDIEYAHAIAPKAKILLVEAASNSVNDLYGGAQYAANHGASVVSMSFGGTEDASVTSLDSTYFNKAGVTFVASSGDGGAEVEHPAASPYVVAVGGTSLSLSANGTYLGESAWSGSGGGVSAYEPKASFQSSHGVNFAGRAVPDVAYDADPSTGVYVVNGGSYYNYGGTSAGAPQWAGLFSLVSQDRAANGLAMLSSSEMLEKLYTAYASPYASLLFHDITTGSNGLAANAGYDLVTGIGSPIANTLVPYLALGLTPLLPEPALAASLLLLVVAGGRRRRK